MYAVTGATGSTGQVVVKRLLAAGQPVRAIGRSADHLKKLSGVEPVVGSLDDPAVVSRAFKAALGVYAMTPPDLAAPDYAAAQERIGVTVAGALREARVPHVVHLSSLGANHRRGLGPVSGLGRQEERLVAIPGCNVLNLRPAFFMENLYGVIGMIRQGFVATPLPADLRFPWISNRDIGPVAAEALLTLDFEGHQTRELHGERDLTWNEVVRIVGNAIGNPELRYVQATYEETEKGFIEAGMSPANAASIMGMYRGFEDGRMAPLESRNDWNTTPTSIETFAKELAATLR
jgi:uncharacterized protein YbjT (DUF2867 family)